MLLPLTREDLRLRVREETDDAFVGELASDDELRRLTGLSALPEQLTRALTSDEGLDLVIERGSDRPIGRILVHHETNSIFRYGVGLLEQCRGHGYGRDALELLLDFYFNQLGYRKAEVEIRDDNQNSIGLHARLGFEREATRRAAILGDGSPHDIHLLAATGATFAAAMNARRTSAQE